MTSLTRAEAASRAGIDTSYLDQLIDLGIVVPRDDGELTEGHARRAQMARTLEGAGIDLASLAAVIRDGRISLDFMDTPVYERFATLSGETFLQVSERTRVPIDVLMVIREATGSAAPDPADLMREDELAVVPFIEAELETGFTQISVVRTLRVAGDGLRRLAETESNAWRSDFLGAFLAAGKTPAQAAAATGGETGQRLDAATDRALLAIWHAQQARAWTANIIGGFEQTLIASGLLTKPDRPPAMCFLDITGYTRLVHERGDQAAASVAERLGRLVSGASIRRGGRPVKWLGDGVMLWFRDPGEAVLAALEMVEAASSAGLPPAHVGLHAGPVLFQEGDYFGQTVNLAARIADYARPGEVLASQEVVDASRDERATFTEIGPVELKGVVDVIRLYTAHRGTGPE